MVLFQTFLCKEICICFDGKSINKPYSCLFCKKCVLTKPFTRLYSHSVGLTFIHGLESSKAGLKLTHAPCPGCSQAASIPQHWHVSRTSMADCKPKPNKKQRLPQPSSSTADGASQTHSHLQFGVSMWQLGLGHSQESFRENLNLSFLLISWWEATSR